MLDVLGMDAAPRATPRGGGGHLEGEVVTGTHLASIIVNNHNYGRFLREAIDSALRQSYARTEVIVVDDGSTDESREIISSYGNQVIPVMKENGGQTSAFNAGFFASRGKVVCFLDADDTLLPTALARAMDLFLKPDVIKVHWPLRLVDVDGHGRGEVMPDRALSEGNLRDLVVRDGPDACSFPPTTGNAWRRTFLERVFPLPEIEKAYGIGSASADAYLSTVASLFGIVKAIHQPQGQYRIHGKNDFAGTPFDERVVRHAVIFDHLCAALRGYCRNMGIDVDPEVWRASSWWVRLRRSLEEIEMLVPVGDVFVLVDEEQWGADPIVAGRRRVPFLEQGGRYWGPPPDDETAIRELDRLRDAGASHIVVAWPAFWWLDHYAGFRRHLRTTFRCSLENDRLVVFDLRQ
jgi:glycosyltransferase involved in cell wall biosynthesis